MSTAFAAVKTTYIESLDVTLHEYLHGQTQAKHFHIETKDPNNAFLVAFLTVPSDSTGVAHILEHTALCGSKNYPVRDPFFMMIRRSLNTFMNAFTSSDWTAYPFASQNKKDFYNLLNVYLDAAFFPNLSYLDFLQEGHRLEFAQLDDATSPLEYKGVVFNEMKGAMSSISSLLYQEITKNLFPTVTYHHNSGGDPKAIPDLTHAALKAFHAKHYHPSNSIFMTYGNMDPLEHQRVFEEKVLAQFDYQDFDFSVPDEQRFLQPLNVTSEYPLSKEEAITNKTHVINAWLLNPISDAYEVMRARILSDVLLDNANSPLRYALESSDLGASPSMFCGLEDSTRELFFACGLEGAAEDATVNIDALITNTLITVRDNPIDQAAVESVLHQMELSAREISGGGYPYGLRLMLDCLAPELHGGSALSGLAIDEVLVTMREEIKNHRFIPELIDRLLLNNPHKLTLTVKPSHSLAESLVNDEQARLRTIQSALTDAQKAKIISDAQELKAHQAKIDDISCLPKVTRDDIPEAIHIPRLDHQARDSVILATGTPNTNGMVYASLVVELPRLTQEEVELLPYLDTLLTEVGCGVHSYREQQARVSAVTGGLSAATVFRPSSDHHDIQGLWILSGKALVTHEQALSDLLKATFFDARFDEYKRIQELLAQLKMSKEQGIISNGHQFAMGAASQRIAPINYLSERIGGMASIRSGRILETQLKDEALCRDFSQRLVALLNKLRAMPYELLMLTSATGIDEMVDYAYQQLVHSVDSNPSVFVSPYTLSTEPLNMGWAVNAPVHYCAKSYPTVVATDVDAPVFNVLAGFLRNGYLHGAIREQGGAYGGGAIYHGRSGAFNFFSYRDPRLGETLKDFDQAIHWLLSTSHDERALEEAILGVISAIDKPSSPAGEYNAVYLARRFGVTEAFEREYRANVLKVTLEDLKRVTETYLHKRSADIAVLGPKEGLDAAGLTVNIL